MLEGDIKQYFDNINHNILAKKLEKHIDSNLMRLYWKLVNAGYVENENKLLHSLTGVPQGRNIESNII